MLGRPAAGRSHPDYPGIISPRGMMLDAANAASLTHRFDKRYLSNERDILLHLAHRNTDVADIALGGMLIIFPPAYRDNAGASS